MKKDFLKALKGKIISIHFMAGEETTSNNCILLDYNDKFLKIKNYTNEIFLLNTEGVIYIQEADKENKEKFKSYCQKHKKKKNFKGDYDDGIKKAGYFG